MNIFSLLILFFAFFDSGFAKGLSDLSDDSVSAFLSNLVAADLNRADIQDVRLNYQNMASHSNFDHDNADKPIQSCYTIPDASLADPDTNERLGIIDRFLDAISGTIVYQETNQFLVNNGLIGMLSDHLKTLWFTSYARQRANGSSGFETVFAGEIMDGDVVGLTNWLRFYGEELSGRINYHGWFTRQLGTQVSLQFSWEGKRALERSFLLNTSPEFEILAYSICALTGKTRCEFSLNSFAVILNVETKKLTASSAVVTSAYPTLGNNGVPTSQPISPTHKSPSVLGSLVLAMRLADEDRADASQYQLNWGKQMNEIGRSYPNPLFTRVDERLFDRPVYAVLRQLVYDKNLLNPDVCVTEPSPYSGFRRSLYMSILTTFMNTTVFPLAHQFLVSEGKLPSDETMLREQLFTLWFGQYSRCEGPLGSSGFEHVFSGEWNRGEVDGQHNWMRYYLLEKIGNISYKGYYSYDAELTGTFEYRWEKGPTFNCLISCSQELTGTFEYRWEKELKEKGGFLIGTSPAFDFSLFTVCALTQPGSKACAFEIDGFPLTVTSYTQDCEGHGTCLSTSYPVD